VLKNFTRGAILGITELVPGISGSTVALVLGFYHRLIDALSNLTTPKRKQALPFLIPFSIGVVLVVFVSMFGIEYLLRTYRTPTLMFFMGIIVAYLPVLWKEGFQYQQRQQKPKTNHYILMLFFYGIVVVGQLFTDITNIDASHLSLANYMFLFIGGFVASTAFVLPGISGALILTILGMYEIALSSLINFYLPVIIPIVIGVVTGILFASRLVKYLLDRFPFATYSVMIGLISGSLIVLLKEMDGIGNWAIAVSSFATFFAGMYIVYQISFRKNKVN